MADHLEARRNVFQHLGHVFAEPAHRTAASRATAILHRRTMHDLFARQMVRQRPADRLVALNGIRSAGLVLLLALPALFLDIVEQEFQLRDGRVELLGGAAELQAPQPSDLHLQLLDLDPRRHDHALQQRNIIRQ